MKKFMIFAAALLIYSSVYADRLKIVASIVPLYNITAAIAGNKADLMSMVPPGTSPHTFSPKPSQIIAMSNADLFIKVGSGMEFWADKIVDAAANTKMMVITITDGIPLLAGDSDEPVDKQGHRAGNPHIWLDPVLTKQFSGRICDTLVKLDPADSSYFKNNYKKFSKELDKLDAYIKVETGKFRVKELVSFHPAWVYFEKRYGLKEIAVIETVPGRQPSPKELQEIVVQIKKYSIKTIFAEIQLPRKSADVIAKEAGVTVLILNPLGDIGEDYATFMKNNFKIITEAMK